MRAFLICLVGVVHLNGAAQAETICPIAQDILQVRDDGTRYVSQEVKRPDLVDKTSCNGLQIASTTVYGTSEATWTLGRASAAGTIIAYDGTHPSSDGAVPQPVVRTNPIKTALPKLRAAVSNVLAGSGRARYAMIGDSTTAGWGDNGTSPGSGSAGDPSNILRAKSLPTELAKKFKAAGIPTRTDAIFGSSFLRDNTLAGYTHYNPDLGSSGGWTIAKSGAGADTLGGQYFFLDKASNGTLTFTPQENTNTFEIYTAQGAGNGGLTVSDGTTSIDIETNGNTSGYQKATFTRPISSNSPISISRWSGATNSTGGVFLGAIVPFDTTRPMVEIWNLGWAGSKVSQWVDDPASHSIKTMLAAWLNGSARYSIKTALATLQADAWSIELGANDANAEVPTATYKANLSTLIGHLGPGLAHDTFLISVHGANPSSNSYQIPAGYVAAMHDLVTAGGYIPLVNFADNGLTAMPDYFDSIHLTNSGYAKEAGSLYRAMTQ